MQKSHFQPWLATKAHNNFENRKTANFRISAFFDWKFKECFGKILNSPRIIFDFDF